MHAPSSTHLSSVGFKLTIIQISLVFIKKYSNIDLFHALYFIIFERDDYFMNLGLKNIALILVLLCTSVAIAADPPTETDKPKKESRSVSAMDHFESHVKSLFYDCGLLNQMSYRLFKKAVIGYYNMKRENLLSGHLLTVIDFRQASNQERLYIIDMEERKLIRRSLVAHGKNSGGKYPVSFSNTPESNKSSIGFYVTAETYYGENGLSLKIDGKDFPFNTNVRKRHIVIHGSDYV